MLPRAPHVTPFTGFDLAHLVQLQARARADHPFLVWAPFEGPGRTWTYAAFEDAVARVAGAMARRGVRLGDRIILHLENAPEAVIAWHACARLGATAVSTNARSTGPELAWFAENCGAVAAVTQPRLAPLVRAHCPQLSFVAVTETDDGAAVADAAAPAHDDAFVRLVEEAEPLPLRPPDPLLPAAIQYTSGTTSRPKGVVTTHANGLWAGRIGVAHTGIAADDVFLVHLPLYHVIALSYSLLATLWAGGTVVLMPRFSASRFWDVACRQRCTWTSMVPFCVRALAEREVPAAHHFRAWGNAFYSPALEARYRLRILGWWGMTEMVTHGIVSDLGKPTRPGAIGRPAPEYELAILRRDGTPVEPGEAGELRVRGLRGVTIFREYFENPEATATSFDEFGFFMTGDRVTLHEDGFIEFADRLKDMLKVGGENVAASEVERVIRAVDGVAEVAVVGAPHPMLGEVPVAFVEARVSSAAAAALTAAVLDVCRRELAAFKIPRAVMLVEELPRGSVEKISKVKLREMAAEVHLDA